MIRIERRLWEREGRVAFLVVTFDAEKRPDTKIVVCGSVASIMRDELRFGLYAPKASGATTTTLNYTKSTTHFAANVYSLAGSYTEQVQSLSEIYKGGTERQFSRILHILCDETLADWSKHNQIPKEEGTLEDYCREHLGLTPELFPPSDFQERVRAIIRQVSMLGVRLNSDGELTFNYKDKSYTYPDPSSVLSQNFDLGQQPVLMNTPGTLALESVLTDGDKRAWVTDFSRAGLAPVMWNFIELEAALRYDSQDAVKLFGLHKMEQLLVTGRFCNLEVDSVEDALHKRMKIIQKLRELADEPLGKDRLAYHLGMLFQVAKRLSEFDPTKQRTPHEWTHAAHLLLSAAMLNQQLSGNIKRRKKGLRIDMDERVVWIGDKRLELSGDKYDILLTLYKKPGHFCTHEELLKVLNGDTYRPGDNCQRGCLTTTINRLRSKIEENPRKPRYLLLVKGSGYRLILNPEN